VVVLRFEVVVVVVVVAGAAGAAKMLHYSEVAAEVVGAVGAVGVQIQNHSPGEAGAVQKEAPFFQAEAVQVQPDGPRGAEAEAAVEVRMERLR
jgi:hypothetical protein